MSKRVFNSLIEYLVVAGCDRDTGLKINENQVSAFKFQHLNNLCLFLKQIVFKLSVWRMYTICPVC